jgi:hypothetical protein
MTTHKYSICLIGVENVGKRSLLFELSGIGGEREFFINSIATKVVHKFKPASSENIYELTIHVIDKIGQNDDAIKKSDGIMYVIDKNNPSSYSSINNCIFYFYFHSRLPTFFIFD